MKVATWNINSVRLRIDSAVRYLEVERPDVLCLQEIKCNEDQFPAKAFAAAGYAYAAVHGQGGHHGVATVSRLPLSKVERLYFCGKEDARHIAVTVGGVRVHNFYVPSGGDEPDPAANEKFAHKLQFLEELRVRPRPGSRAKAVLVGDLNVAPGENDVWSHKQLLNVVSHTPVETDLLKAVISEGGWIDVAREHTPGDEKLYTWWSYRARDWRASNRGRRLDHIWVSAALKKAATAKGRDALRISSDCRGWEKPSDHVPVSLDLAL
ncbi:MAG: exodeoxyribonuclease III [Alphaproteobacteria bacterium]|nr:exodeoxyribonuclease III [Alphaproteobacteria bacterium]